MGQIVNTDAQYLSRRLNALGISVYYHTTVGDNPGRMEQTLRLALSRSDVVITTGGLGPTGDDLSKEIVARLLGLDLSRNASEAAVGEQDEVVTRQGHIHGQARALCAPFLFCHLTHHYVAGRNLVRPVADVQKAVALESDVDERRLHAAEHIFNLALVDVADMPASCGVLHAELDELTVVDKRRPGKIRAEIDVKFFHSSPWNFPVRYNTKPHGETSASLARQPARTRTGKILCQKNFIPPYGFQTLSRMASAAAPIMPASLPRVAATTLMGGLNSAPYAFLDT